VVVKNSKVVLVWEHVRTEKLQDGVTLTQAYNVPDRTGLNVYNKKCSAFYLDRYNEGKCLYRNP
jgi:hypothetical protein